LILKGCKLVRICVPHLVNLIIQIMKEDLESAVIASDEEVKMPYDVGDGPIKGEMAPR
jgi:hypothetical protein